MTFHLIALQIYQKRCSDLLGFDFNVMLRLRRFLDSLSDEKVDEMLRICGKLGVDKALSDVDEIDFQGKLMLKVLRETFNAGGYGLLCYALLVCKPLKSWMPNIEAG